MITCTLLYTSIAESEDLMLDDLEQVLNDNEVETPTAQRIMLAISEAFTNALIHGNGRDADKAIKISLRVDENEVVADITDEGKGGLIRVLQRKPAEPLSECGRGIDLMRHFATFAEFGETETGGLNVRLMFARNREIEVGR